MNQPFFSVVVPTRNRSHLLGFALQCVLGQRFDDFELIVSDNDSSDSTRDVVAQFSDPRVKYVRTPRTLHMPDSWEFALSQAKGRYITYVSDDDGVSPRLLDMIHATLAESRLDIVSWPFGARYHHDTYDEPHLRNLLMFEPVVKRTEEVSPRTILAELSAARYTHKLPRIINSCASASVLDEVRQKFGRVFHPACPDYSAGVAQLTVRPALAYVHDLVLIWGIGKESIGHSQTRGGEAAREFLSQLHDDNAHRTRHVPLQIYSAMNFALDSVLHIKSLAPDRLASLNIDPLSYYTTVGREMLALERNGLDITGQLEEIRVAIQKESLPVRLAVMARLSLVPGGKMIREARHRARARISSIKSLQSLRPSSARLSEFKGEGNGFKNIYEAALQLDRLLGRANASVPSGV